MRYEFEIQEFRKKFEDKKNQKIILYGIGRYTATLVSEIQDFHFVGLMDKDEANTGKMLFGLPIVDLNKAEELADLIVINTQETYWKVIYERIKNSSIPIFYKNGERAIETEKKNIFYPYGYLSEEELKMKINKAEIISFDFYDTLFTRRVCNAQDVIELLEKKINKKWNYKKSFIEVRNYAKSLLDVNYSMMDLYRMMANVLHCSMEDLIFVYNEEIQLEKKLLVPRKEILEVFKAIIKSSKNVYVISDMYMDKRFYIEVFSQYGISLKAETILISGALKKSKKDCKIWEFYKNSIIKDKKALHIGDNIKTDIENPLKYGISAYLTPNPWEAFINSSIRNLAKDISNEYDYTIMGCLISYLFNDPYRIHEDGQIFLKTNYEMGYVVFGPIILSFLNWIIMKGRKDKIDKFVFMSRDGFFLEEDFAFFCKIKNIRCKKCYVKVSRQLAMLATLESKDDVLEYLSIPYTGTVQELFEDRLGLSLDVINNNSDMIDIINQYWDDIKDILATVRNNYLKYLNKFQLNSKSAVIDLGYYGNNQKYLNRLLGIQMDGYYFSANLSDLNENNRLYNMTACFQDEQDLSGENSNILKNMIYLESFLTAPHGMVKTISRSGEFIYAEKKQNQLKFDSKIGINNGVKQFIKDYLELFGDTVINFDYAFIDECFGNFMENLQFSDEIKKSFFNDNAMMNRIESPLFY